jgi:hypothetical protein
MFWCAVFAALLFALVWVLSPQQAPIIAYKLALIHLAAFAAYWIDRWVFPYARPDATIREWGDYLPSAIVYASALLRRAIIVAAAMLAVGLGL